MESRVEDNVVVDVATPPFSPTPPEQPYGLAGPISKGAPRGSGQHAGATAAPIPTPAYSPNKSTGRGAFSFSVGPAHSRINDFDQWYSQLHYDPKKPTAAQRQAMRTAEADAVATARRRMSHGETQRHLLTLTSAVRADLEIFVNHLLDAGINGRSTSFVVGPADQLTPAQAAAAEAAAFTKEAFLQLKTLFDTLDVDKSGTLTFDELQRASIILGRDNYDVTSFRRLDVNRSGSIDFQEMLKYFFPRLSQRYITKCYRDYIKYADAIKTARDRLAPEHLAQIDTQYDLICSRPGGCTVDNMLHFMSTYMKRNRDITEDAFALFDTDKDGSLTREEFTDMVKFSYPPFAREPPRLEEELPQVGKKPGASTSTSARNSGKDGTGAAPAFSLEQLARRRLIHPSAIKVPQLKLYHPEPPHILSETISGGSTDTRCERNRNRMLRIMGKEAVERHERDAALRAKRAQQLGLPNPSVAASARGSSPRSVVPTPGASFTRRGTAQRSPRTARLFVGPD
jgi:Ca2+-binding EF-hand superfamily protein